MIVADSDLGAAALLARARRRRLGNPMIVPMVLPPTEPDGPLRRIPRLSDIETCTVNALLTPPPLGSSLTPAKRIPMEEITGGILG